MLGICIGLQIANVYFIGTLIPDLTPSHSPSGEGSKAVSHSKDKSFDQVHTVKVETNSCLNGIVLSESGNINSAHHQASDKIGEGLKVSARAEDGTVEAIELKDPKQHPFLLLVQWHPERVNQQENPFASKLKERFLKECTTNKK